MSLSTSARLAAFGQDTSRQYDRPNGRKAWRAEHPATVADKERGKEACNEFKRLWRLGELKLSEVHMRHVSYLEERASSPDAPHHKEWYARRLERAHVAHEALQTFTSFRNAAFSVGDCTDFVSTVHGEEHGVRVLMRAKPRRDPYARTMLKDLPAMSANHELRFCGRGRPQYSGRPQYILNMSAECIVDSDGGQLVETEDGIFVSARLPSASRLTDKEVRDLEELIRAWLRRGRYTQRGDSHAAVCVNYVVGGLKGDQDTVLAMPSSHVSEPEKAQKV